MKSGGSGRILSQINSLRNSNQNTINMTHVFFFPIAPLFLSKCEQCFTAKISSAFESIVTLVMVLQLISILLNVLVYINQRYQRYTS